MDNESGATGRVNVSAYHEREIALYKREKELAKRELVIARREIEFLRKAQQTDNASINRRINEANGNRDNDGSSSLRASDAGANEQRVNTTASGTTKINIATDSWRISLVLSMEMLRRSRHGKGRLCF